MMLISINLSTCSQTKEQTFGLSNKNLIEFLVQGCYNLDSDNKSKEKSCIGFI